MTGTLCYCERGHGFRLNAISRRRITFSLCTLRISKPYPGNTYVSQS